jgi:hypothetical protein
MLVVTESAMKNFQEQECFRFENVCYGDGLIDSTAAVIVETNMMTTVEAIDVC